jgi:hypothetical protein
MAPVALESTRDSLLPNSATSPNHALHVYEVRPRKDRRGFDLISDALPFGRLW